MITFRLDYTIEKILKNEDFNAKKTIKILTGKTVPQNDAANVWMEVQTHKWLISKRLGRDIGLRVAAIDYLENFYHPETFYSGVVKRFLQAQSQ